MMFETTPDARTRDALTAARAARGAMLTTLVKGLFGRR